MLPFAHVWELEDGEPVRAQAYFDRSRLTLAAARRQLADVADDLLEQAAEIRRQWARLGDALRAAGLDAPDASDPGGVGTVGSASARLAAVDLADEGATREEVEGFLREEHGVEDASAILDEVFGPPAPEPREAGGRRVRRRSRPGASASSSQGTAASARCRPDGVAAALRPARAPST